MVKHTLKILRCEHCKNLKVCLAFFNIMHERVKSQKNVLLTACYDTYSCENMELRSLGVACDTLLINTSYLSELYSL